MVFTVHTCWRAWLIRGLVRVSTELLIVRRSTDCMRRLVELLEYPASSFPDSHLQCETHPVSVEKQKLQRQKQNVEKQKQKVKKQKVQTEEYTRSCLQFSPWHSSQHGTATSSLHSVEKQKCLEILLAIFISTCLTIFRNTWPIVSFFFMAQCSVRLIVHDMANWIIFCCFREGDGRGYTFWSVYGLPGEIK